jgi:osmoprotectant transport system substrate-binding protein/osmoprotectant transport system permease protein
MRSASRRSAFQTAHRFQRAVWKPPLLGLLATLYALSVLPHLQAEPIIIGSKKFTESYVLAEIAKRAVEDAGIPAEHRQGMGGTIILWQALRTGQIGFYPEYTGTIGEEILKASPSASAADMRVQLESVGIGMTGELGFNNTYALVIQRAAAERLRIKTISDLRNHPELKFGLTHEFLDRRDGWQPLAEKYQLPRQNVSGIDHGLGYAALRAGSIDVKDAYSTDAKIGENDLVVLQDDLQFFPQYKAVFLYRLTLPESVITVLRKLEGTLDENRMIQLNAEAEQTKNYARAADLYFQSNTSRTN